MKLKLDSDLQVECKELLNPAYKKEATFLAQVLIRFIDIIAGLVRLLSFDTFKLICYDRKNR